MFDTIKQLQRQYELLCARMEEPATYSDPAGYSKYEREARELQPIVTAYAEYQEADSRMQEALELMGDSEMRELAQEEYAQAKADKERLEQEIKVLLLPKDPNDAKNVSGEESATVTIKIKNKRTKVIGATNIAFINTPDGFDARSITQLVQTTVRASNNEIDRIAANNLRVVADLSEYTQAGTYQVPVTIYIDGYPDAGVIGDDYKIVVVLEAVE